ncbi:MAG: hypothetical protein Q8O19_00190 [Rectinemataceae bacterium]|nr:hypothetical protein [Rectinemataceae bacterium]
MEETLEPGAQNPNVSVDDAIKFVMDGLPLQVRDFIASEARVKISQELAQKYHLHVDQAGEFERAYLFMLLGIATPEEFVSSLAKTGLSQDVINGLAADVNTQVFIPLREKERQATQTPPLATKPAPLPPPALDYQPAVPTLPGSPVPAPMPPVAVAPSIAPVLAAVEPATVPQPMGPQQHFVHAMPNTQQQGWHPAAAVHIFVPTHGAPMQASAPAPQAPVQEVPVYNASYSEPAPVQAPAVPAQPVYVNPEPQPTPPAAISKEYSADPYREPVQ